MLIQRVFTGKYAKIVESQLPNISIDGTTATTGRSYENIKNNNN